MIITNHKQGDTSQTLAGYIKNKSNEKKGREGKKKRKEKEQSLDAVLLFKSFAEFPLLSWVQSIPLFDQSTVNVLVSNSLTV